VPDSRTLKLKLNPPAARVSFVGAVTSALNALGAKCDATDVAGMSGYAFVINVDPAIGPSGPTAFDTEMLMQGERELGIELQLFTTPRNPRDDDRNAAELFERVREEIDAGRPCVVWGAASTPEFGLVSGYRREAYIVRTAAAGAVTELVVAARELRAEGSFILLTFGGKTGPASAGADRVALTRAVQLLSGRHPCYLPGHTHGAEAFEGWADALGRVDAIDCAYNAACYAELQGFAAEFCARVARRMPAGAASLSEAAAALRASAKNLARLSDLFLPATGPADRAETGARLLGECAGSVRAAGAALQCALALV
jgi:hypothetical protein